MPIRIDQREDAASDNANAQGRGSKVARLVRPGTVVITLAVFAIIFVACGGSSNGTVTKLPSISSRSPVEMKEGLAPNFKFTLFQGEDQLGAGRLDVAGLRGKPLVLNFWAGLCPPCRAELPDLQEFYNKFNDRIALVGIDMGQFTGLGSLQDAKDLLAEMDITYPVGSTDDSSVISKYKVFGLPSTVFIDAAGKVFKNWDGALNFKVLRDQSNKMLSQ